MTDDDVLRTAADLRRAADEHFAAFLRYREALRAYREAHPAPPGHVWQERAGVMLTEPVDEECCHAYEDGSPCGDAAVSWDEDGRGRCEEHRW